MFLKVCVIHFIWSEAATEAPTQVFSCQYCEIFKNTYFEEHLQTTATYILQNVQCYLN